MPNYKLIAAKVELPALFEKRDFSALLGILPSVFLSHENLDDKRDENKANILKAN